MSDYVSRKAVLDILETCRFEGSFMTYALYHVSMLPGITVKGEKKLPRWHVEERMDNKKEVYYVIVDDRENYYGLDDPDGGYRAYKDGFRAAEIADRLNEEDEDE